MEYRDFIKSTIMTIQSGDRFEQLKKDLVEDYIPFSFISEEDVTSDILAEKLCDYFEKLELKTGKEFDKTVEVYMKNLDSIVEGHIVKTPKNKKNDPSTIVPRSRRYYEKAVSLKNDITPRRLIDYSRIMLCLYSEIIKNGYKEIDNLDFSADCLDPKNIIEAMKNEQKTVVANVGKKSRFDIKERYCTDTCTFIIAIILLYKILDDTVLEETDYE